VRWVFIATLTFVYEEVYGFHESIVGLTYLGTSLSIFFGSIIFSVIDRKNGGPSTGPGQRVLLLTAMSGTLAISGSLLMYGWTIENHVHWIVPIIGTFIASSSVIIVLVSIPEAFQTSITRQLTSVHQMYGQDYVFRSYTIYGSAASTAAGLLEGIICAGLPIAGSKMYEDLGYGWGNSVLAFIMLALVLVPPMVYIFGARLRASD
jgi:hypothetical protein